MELIIILSWEYHENEQFFSTENELRKMINNGCVMDVSYGFIWFHRECYWHNNHEWIKNLRCHEKHGWQIPLEP